MIHTEINAPNAKNFGKNEHKFDRYERPTGKNRHYGGKQGWGGGRRVGGEKTGGGGGVKRRGKEA